MSDFYKTEGEKFCRVKESGAFMNCINCQPLNGGTGEMKGDMLSNLTRRRF